MGNSEVLNYEKKNYQSHLSRPCCFYDPRDVVVFSGADILDKRGELRGLTRFSIFDTPVHGTSLF